MKRFVAGVVVAFSIVVCARAASVSLTNADAFGFTSFITGLNWSDGQAPSGTNDYVVATVVATNVMAMRTPAVSNNFVFAGNSLVLGNGTTNGQLTFKGLGSADIITITNLTLNIGVVANGQGGNFFLAGDVTLGAGGGVFDMGGGRTVTVSATVGGVGNLTAANIATNGGGTVIMGANNSYLGTTTIATGTLQVGTGGTTGSLGAGNVINRGTLIFSRGDSHVVTNNISGNTGNLLVRSADLTLLNSGATNLQLQVPDAGGPVASVVLNLSNSVVQVLANVVGNFNVGGVANTAASGTINMNGGSLTVANEMFLPAGAGNSRGYFNLFSGNVLISNWAGVGRGSSGVNNYGELNVSGGSWSNVANNHITVASFAGNTGVVRVAGGRVFAQNSMFVGESGVGFLNVGNSGGVDVNYLGIGQVNAGVGAVVITGGVVQVRLSVGVANGAATVGSLDMGGGTLFANLIYRTGAGTINLSGGTLAPYNAAANFTAPMSLTTVPTLGGNGVVTFQSLGASAVPADINVHGVLSGDGSVQKTGPGALNLNAANSYSGPTTVGAGYLFGTGSVASAVTVSNGAFIGPNSLAQLGTFIVSGPVVLESGAGVSALLNGSTPTLIAAGGLTGNANNPVSLLSTSPSGVQTGTYALVVYTTLSGFNFTTGALPVGVQGYLNDNAGAQTIEFVVTNVSGGLTWSGAVNNQWDANATTNWLISGTATPSIYNNGDPVRFDDAGLNTSVSNTVIVTPGNMVVSNTAVAYTFSGAGINGFGGITKDGTNSLKINSANGYSGTNYILAGTIVASNATALGAATAPTIISGGGTLDTGGQNLGGEPVFISGAGVGGNGAIVNSGAATGFGLQYVTLTGNATVGGVNRWDIRNGTAPFLNLNGFTLAKTGTNQVSLSQGFMATNAGDIVINAGVVSLEVAGDVLSGPGSLVVNPAGTLGLYQSPNVWKTNVYNGGTVLALAGGGTNQIGAPVVINTNTTINSTGGDISFTNVISGPAGFTKIGVNNVMLVATNTYEGATIITAGGVMLGNGVNANGTLGGGNVSNNSQLIFNRPDSHVVTNAIAGGGQTLARRGETTLLNTSVTNVRLHVLDIYIPSGNAILNISNSTIHITNNVARSFNIGVSTNIATTGIVNMASGFVKVTNELWVAAGAGFSRGVFNLMGGNVNVANWTAIGRGDGGVNNYGELNISGGTWSNVGPNNISIASFVGNTGRVTVSGGRLYAANIIWVGEGGAGSLNVSGGVVEPNSLVIGQGGGGIGRLDLGGGIVTSRTTIILGNATGTISTIVQTGGTLVAGTTLTLGNAANTIATLYQSGGSIIGNAADNTLANFTSSYAYVRSSAGAFTVNQNFQIGRSGIGIMEILGTAADTQTFGYPVVGRLAGGRGVLDVSGGSFTHNSAASHLIIGEVGHGILNVRGSGTVTVHSARTGDGLRIGHNNVAVVGTGVVNIASGGTIIAPAVTRTVTAGAIGTLNFNGGTLRANTNNAAYMTGLSAANIYSGGAQLDDGGFVLTIAQPLLAPTGSGLTAIPVVTGGAGYKGPPYVSIQGGGGSNATALAQMDIASGALTNLLITNPGTDYTSLPAITLIGGGPVTAATLGTPATNANTSGGLTKLGTGSLTLTATSTYSGPSIISNGTLALTGSAAFDNSQLIIVQTGAILSVTARTDGSLAVGPARTLTGAGTVVGIVNNDGNVTPGNGPGILTITGNYNQTNGTLNIQLGGTTPGTDYDQLLISGTATWGGTLNVSFINAYTGIVGDTFLVASASGAGTGAFATTNLPALGGTRGWDLQYIGGNAILLSITNAFSNLYVLAQGPEGDDDLDGFANLLEYVTGSNPTNSGSNSALSAARTNGTFALKFLRDTNTVDATLIVEGAYSTTNNTDWIGIATNLNGSWGSNTNVIELGTNPVNVTAYDPAPATNRFLRLRVTRP